MVVGSSCHKTQTMYHLGYESTAGREIKAAQAPAMIMTYSGMDRNPAIDLRSGLRQGRGFCMYQVPVTVNSDSSSGENNIYSCTWEKPTNPGAEITSRHMLGKSYREKWEQLRHSTNKDFTMPAKDYHSSGAMLDVEPKDCRKDMHRIPAEDTSNMFGNHSDSAIDDAQIKLSDSHLVSPTHSSVMSPYSRTVGPLETPKTPCVATPVKVSTPIHDKSPANLSQPVWFDDAILTPATDQNSSDLAKCVPFRKQNGNPGHDRSNMEVFSSNLPECGTCRGRSHDMTHCGMHYARDNGLVSNVLLGVLCLMMSAFGLVLLLRLTYHTSEGVQVQSGDSLLTSNSSYTILKDIAVGLSVLVVFCNVWCLLTMALVSYLAARLLKCQNGHRRASEFIHQCEVTRVAAASGAFVSVPVFLLALLLYTIIDYSFVSAVICVVILSSGTTCTIITIVHSVCTWHQQKSMTILQPDPDQSSSPDDARKALGSVQNPAVNYFELSTLV